MTIPPPAYQPPPKRRTSTTRQVWSVVVVVLLVVAVVTVLQRIGERSIDGGQPCPDRSGDNAVAGFINGIRDGISRCE